MKLPRPAFCPAFRRRFFSSRLSASRCPSCGAFASAGCATAPPNRMLCGAPKRLFDAGRGLRNFRAARFEGTRCRRQHDSGGRLSCCAGRVSGHCSDFLSAVLRGSDDRFARLRRHGLDHRFRPLLECRRDNAACPSRFPGTASGLCDRSGRSPCGGHWMRISAAIGFCAMYFQRGTQVAFSRARRQVIRRRTWRRIGCRPEIIRCSLLLPWNGPGRLALSVSRLRHAPKSRAAVVLVRWRGPPPDGPLSVCRCDPGTSRQGKHFPSVHDPPGPMNVGGSRRSWHLSAATPRLVRAKIGVALWRTTKTKLLPMAGALMSTRPTKLATGRESLA